MLYYIVLYYILLYCIVFYYIIMVLNYAGLFRDMIMTYMSYYMKPMAIGFTTSFLKRQSADRIPWTHSVSAFVE